ncbi:MULTISPECIES: succinate dehydrogenase, cytochrome b556 subunit [Nitrosomonas]|jgi:succinate dehydrogenase / fumarate reductase cytochrome b subunit|uniref:Succinate dehydrogenase cytochrome b556 subunit n=1 Tax=Nitrosomonas oligotropha TaxID=42354 RepID=A0A1H8S3Z2_9PROT|nr:succinate dehydrogenase, cytochrome b556 subunit [Nitrosomonas oligotropha]MBK7492480.1 succinate dehydrogenase, cytochrome b556 subunit [Nitrosomonas sp.]MBP9100395.1 succinate dehydrogenase, cytochrome b556 subunit [Nitrosomonas sp.]SDX01233.1 succinate dehydrogenase subunit C [Nitrosomonas oligotropha]SEO73038.1 succinate dehydrogenase subunit C [Nitrosomonas oligotropha]
MEAKLHHKRPKHLNLLKIKQPLPAVVSILHRISGALLFFPGIPLLLCGLQMLLQSSQSFEVLQDYLRNPVIKLALLLPLWFFLHHLCAGIRHVLLDLQIGIVLAQARTSSKLVLAAGFLLTALIGWQLW